jgi:hypothetical protein
MHFMFCNGVSKWCTYYKFLQAARETGALKDAKDKLEKRVEELTSLLELEKQLRVITISYVGFLLLNVLDAGIFSLT